MDMRTDPFLGKIIRGYRLEQLLGRGNATAVYRARTEELWQVPELIVTILLVPEYLSSHAKKRFAARFEDITKRLTSLRHPFLLPLYGYGQQEGMYYLLAPDLQGETLAHHIQKHKRFTPAEIPPIFTPIATALSYAHQQSFVYQFFQPASILLMNSMPTQVTGLGLSQLLCLRDLEEEPAPYSHLKNFAGAFMGAPHYLAPEVVKKGEVNPRSDVYSLGILLYEMLSNQSPFHGDDYLTIAQKHVREPIPSFHDAAPDLPVALELIINRALHRTPEQRFSSPDELVAAYTHVLDERLHGPRFFNVVEAIEKIRSQPTLPPQLRLSPPDQVYPANSPMSLKQGFLAAEREEQAQSHDTLEDKGSDPGETFSSPLPDPKKNEQEQEMRFVEQEKFSTSRYDSQPPIQKDVPAPEEQTRRSKGPITAPLNYQDLEKSDAAQQAFKLISQRAIPKVQPDLQPEPAPIFEIYSESEPKSSDGIHDAAQDHFQQRLWIEPESKPDMWIEPDIADIASIPVSRLERPPVLDVNAPFETSLTSNTPEHTTESNQKEVPQDADAGKTSRQLDDQLPQIAHHEVREMALQLQQMKERLKAQSDKKTSANRVNPSADTNITPTSSTD